MDPEYVAAFAADPSTKLRGGPPEGMSIEEWKRQAMEMVHLVLNRHYGTKLSDKSQYAVADKTVPVAGGEIPVRIITPTSGGNDATYPVLVWFHGGGFIYGDLEMDDNHLRTIAIELGLVVVNVNYRLAPQYPFPVPFEDSYAAVKWAAEHATDLKVSLSKGYLVGGVSAGGNLAAAIALQARDDAFFEGRPLTGQYLREAGVVHPEVVPEKYKSEWRSFGEDMDMVTVPAAGLMKVYKLYQAPPSDLRLSPLLAPSHAGLAPAFIQCTAVDTLRDDGVVYDRALREAAVPTRFVMHPGVPHGFYYTFPAIAAGVQVDREARDGLRWLLSFTNAA